MLHTDSHECSTFQNFLEGQQCESCRHIQQQYLHRVNKQFKVSNIAAVSSHKIWMDLQTIFQISRGSPIKTFLVARMWSNFLRWFANTFRNMTWGLKVISLVNCFPSNLNRMCNIQWIILLALNYHQQKSICIMLLLLKRHRVVSQVCWFWINSR